MRFCFICPAMSCVGLSCYVCELTEAHAEEESSKVTMCVTKLNVSLSPNNNSGQQQCCLLCFYARI